MCPHMINYVVFRHTNSKKCKVENLFCKGTTVEKFHDFCIIQILREIKFEDSHIAKSAILTHLEALNFDFL